MKRLVLAHGKNIIIVAQDIRFNDAENFFISRQDENTKDKIGTHGCVYDIERIKKDMNPSIEFKKNIGSKTRFIIISSDDNRYLGDISAVYEGDSIYSLGITITEKERGKGFGKETIISLINYMFDQGVCDVIIIGVYKNNPRAYKLYKEIGFIYQTTKDVNYVINGINYRKDILIMTKEHYFQIYH